MTTLTNDQITAGAAVLCDHGQPIGRNAAIEVADAMQGVKPTIPAADVLTIPTAIMNLPPVYQAEPGDDYATGYATGHRDARHAAADLVLARADELKALATPSPQVADIADVAKFKQAFHEASRVGAGYDEAVAVGLAASRRAAGGDVFNECTSSDVVLNKSGNVNINATPAPASAGHPKCHKCHGNSITHASFCPLFDSAKEQNAMQVYRAGQAAPALPENVREFVQAVADHYTGTDNQERLFCYGCDADLDDHEDHKPDCIVLRAKALIAAQPAEGSANQPEHVAELTISSTGLSLLTRSYTETDKALGEGSYKLYLGPAEVRMSPVNVTKAIKG